MRKSRSTLLVGLMALAVVLASTTSATASATTEYVSVAGENRYATAIAASQLAFPGGAPTVVIATGMNWPDALGGSSLAGSVKGPMLLVGSDADVILPEIDRLGAETAYILGGETVISPAIEKALADKLGESGVIRIGGHDRYATAGLIADKVMAASGYDGTAFFATSAAFPDAVAAAPLAAAKGWPIFLVAPGSTSVSVDTSVSSGIVLGGTSAVSEGFEKSLSAILGADDVHRISGADRYATSVAIARYGVASANLGWNNMAIATGLDFPDALAGGVMQGACHSVILLTPGDTLDSGVASQISDQRANIFCVHYLGGTSALSTGVRNSVAAQIGNTTDPTNCSACHSHAVGVSGCEVCHTDRSYLLSYGEKKVASLISAGTSLIDSHGAAITAETIADSAYVDKAAMGTHASRSCVDCHNGVAAANTSEAAHTNGWIADPTADGGTTCAGSGCHDAAMVEEFKNSLHYTVSGINNGLCERLKDTPDAQATFDTQFPRCNSCHATCGQCHVSKPNTAGSGLLKGHKFVKSPDTKETCSPCHHTSGPLYMRSDTHYLDQKMECIACHTDSTEFHGRAVADMPDTIVHTDGSGKIIDLSATNIGPKSEPDMKSGIVKVTCAKCHASETAAHGTTAFDHSSELDCYACHASVYPNCTGCHSGKVGLTEDKAVIGLSEPGNPDSKLTTLVHNPPATDMYGPNSPVVIDLEATSTKSFWGSYSAHSVQRTPLVRDGATTMCENCHDGGRGEIFLTNDDLTSGVDAASDFLLTVPSSRLPMH